MIIFICPYAKMRVLCVTHFAAVWYLFTRSYENVQNRQTS